MAMISVVIPVYNIEAHLAQCLDSVAGQTLSDLEVICVDDGSTDASPAILAEYARRDARFRVIRQKNAGPGAARNRGMALATGEYLIFLDSDDWFEADFLARMAARAEETGADVTICRSDEFDTRSGRVYDGGWMLKQSLLPGAVFSPREAAGAVFQFTYGWPWDKLYRRDYILKEAFRYPDLAVSQDLVFVYPSVFCAGRGFGPGAHPPPGQPARVGVQLPFKNAGGLVSGAEAGGGVSGGARADGDLPAELPQLGHGVSGVACVQHRRPGGPAAVFPGPAPELASGAAPSTAWPSMRRIRFFPPFCGSIKPSKAAARHEAAP